MNIRHPQPFGWHHSQKARQLSHLAPRRLSREARGFTLIELVVVLAIMVLVTSITLGAFRSLTENNQRTACQTNLSQIYQGLRLYMADQDGQAPPFNPNANPKAMPPEKKNIGLWNLWTYPSSTDADKIATVGLAPTARYLRSTKLLHCPADSEPGATLRPNPGDLYVDATKQDYNPDFLSYQMFATDHVYSTEDTSSDITADTKAQTYLPTRVTSATDPQFKRQLRQPDPTSTKTPPDFLKRPPLDSTIVTWCRHHRDSRDYDNVLFFDGSVQLIPREQDQYKTDGSCDTTGVILKGSDRVPRRSDCS